MTKRYCQFIGKEVEPLGQVTQEYHGVVITQWLCSAHDAADRTPDDPCFDALNPQVHGAVETQNEADSGR